MTNTASGLLVDENCHDNGSAADDQCSMMMISRTVSKDDEDVCLYEVDRNHSNHDDVDDDFFLMDIEEDDECIAAKNNNENDNNCVCTTNQQQQPKIDVPARRVSASPTPSSCHIIENDNMTRQQMIVTPDLQQQKSILSAPTTAACASAFTAVSGNVCQHQQQPAPVQWGIHQPQQQPQFTLPSIKELDTEYETTHQQLMAAMHMSDMTRLQLRNLAQICPNLSVEDEDGDRFFAFHEDSFVSEQTRERLYHTMMYAASNTGCCRRQC